MPQVAVEISAAEGEGRRDPAGDARSAVSPAKLREALLSACTDAVATAECVSADAARRATTVALVVWRGQGRVRIEVGQSRASSDDWVVRKLRFGPNDAPLEVWRAVGYAVGTLAGEVAAGKGSGSAAEGSGASGSGPGTSGNQGATPESSAAGSETPPGEAVPKEDETEAGEAELRAPTDRVEPAADDSGAASDDGPERGVTERRWWAEAGGALGRGLGGEGLRIGGYARVSRSFERPFVTAALAYSVDPTNERGLSAQRFAPSLGGGYAILTGRWLSVDLRGEFVAEYLSVRVDDPASGRADRRGRWTAAFAAGAEFASTLTGPVALVVGAEATVRTNRTDVQVRDTTVAAVPMVDFVGLAGIRVGF